MVVFCLYMAMLKRTIVRATDKQKRAFVEITRNNRSVTSAMRLAGYDDTTVTKPKNLTESKGFNELMDAMGLTDEFLNRALKEDIENKPTQRVAELKLAYQLKGKLKESETGSTFTPATINIGIIQQDTANVNPPTDPALPPPVA